MGADNEYFNLKTKTMAENKTIYFLDTEFIEGTQEGLFGSTKPTIDLISIGIVDENGREFYAISKDFNLKEAWNRFDLLEANTSKNHNQYDIKVYWIRDNVLKPIFVELYRKSVFEYLGQEGTLFNIDDEHKFNKNVDTLFTYKKLAELIDKYGERNIDIANGICAFIYGDDCGVSGMSAIEMATKYEISDKTKEPIFYGWYSAYDHVAMCWLYGKMINLPTGFPMYTRDLKQIVDENELSKEWVKKYCPDPIGAHNSLIDSKWNLKLYNTLKEFNYIK